MIFPWDAHILSCICGSPNWNRDSPVSNICTKCFRRYRYVEDLSVIGMTFIKYRDNFPPTYNLHTEMLNWWILSDK